MSSATVTPKFVMRLSITFIFIDAQRSASPDPRLLRGPCRGCGYVIFFFLSIYYEDILPKNYVGFGSDFYVFDYEPCPGSLRVKRHVAI